MADYAYVTAAIQRERVEALLAGGKPQQALAATKAFYDVALLQDTEAAVNLVARCLEVAHPDDLSIARRFKAQQVEWSTATTMPATTPALGENILVSIKVPDGPFVSAATAITALDYQSQISKGNLFLVAGKAAEARKAFEAADVKSATQQQATEAVSGIARAIRAQAGAIGPANAYIVEQQAMRK